jgi:hypothetical protein
VEAGVHLHDAVVTPEGISQCDCGAGIVSA